MTTVHDDEALESAVSFAASSAWPAEAYEEPCRATVRMTVGDRGRNQRVTDYLNAGVPSRREAQPSLAADARSNRDRTQDLTDAA